MLKGSGFQTLTKCLVPWWLGPAFFEISPKKLGETGGAIGPTVRLMFSLKLPVISCKHPATMVYSCGLKIQVWGGP